MSNEYDKWLIQWLQTEAASYRVGDNDGSIEDNAQRSIAIDRAIDRLKESAGFVSDRGIPLAGQPKAMTLTVELYVKWYSLFIIKPSGEVEAVGFMELEKGFQNAAFVDHVPNPAAVEAYAQMMGYEIDELAWDLIVGRWQSEVVDTDRASSWGPDVAARYHLTDKEQNTIDEAVTFLEGWHANALFPVAAKLLRRIVSRACPTWEPNWASPPGATIKMMMGDRKFHLSMLWGRLELTAESLDHLFDGRLTIDDELAQKLADLFGVAPGFWLERERLYRSHLMRLDPAYIPQGIASDCLAMLQRALKGPPDGTPNTLWDMVKSVCETRERRHDRFYKALVKLLKDIERGDKGVWHHGPEVVAAGLLATVDAS